MAANSTRLELEYRARDAAAPLMAWTDVGDEVGLVVDEVVRDVRVDDDDDDASVLAATVESALCVAESRVDGDASVSAAKLESAVSVGVSVALAEAAAAVLKYADPPASVVG